MALRKYWILVLPGLIAALVLIADSVPFRARAWDPLPGEKPPTGPQIVLDLHCHVCHVMPEAEKHTLIGAGGVRIIPIIEFEFNRARPEWVFEFLKEPIHLRPELHAQMPNFGLSDEEALALTRFLMTLKLKRDVYVPRDMPAVLEITDPNTLKLAQDAFNLYKCFQCHLLEGKVIDPEKGQSGPDFIHTYNRLKVDFNYQWLVDPQAFIPGTKMPNFFYSDGEELIDDPGKDMYHILVYMYSLGEHKDYKDFQALEQKYPNPTADQGKKLAEDLYCTACHEFEGWEKLTPQQLVQKHENYDLTHVASRRDRAWLTAHFKKRVPDRPPEGTVTRRPGFNLNNYEIKTLVDYLCTIK